MSRVITLSAAINEALHHEMERDDSVVVLGEDVSGGAGGDGEFDCWGGVYGFSKGLKPRWPDRVLDCPISENGFMGMAIGAAAAGLRPVVDLMILDFAGVCFDQFLNQMGKLRYMSGGQMSFPLTILATYGAGISAAAQHSGALHALFAHIPGLKVALPIEASEQKGMIIEAIRSDEPTIVMQHKTMLYAPGEVPEEAYTIPFGKARFLRHGNDATVIGIGRMALVAQEAAKELGQAGMECDVIDLRSISPLDTETIFESVERTGVLVVVDEGNPRCSVATDICGLVSQERFGSLRSAPRVVTAPHVPVPFSPALERMYLPDAARVVESVRAAVDGANALLVSGDR